MKKVTVNGVVDTATGHYNEFVRRLRDILAWRGDLQVTSKSTDELHQQVILWERDGIQLETRVTRLVARIGFNEEGFVIL